MLLVAVLALIVGFLILRRRGVYFSLMTLAFTALLYAIAFRWTEFTGGESGLGGVVRPAVFGIDLGDPWTYLIFVSLVGFLIAWFLLRVVNSPFGTVLVAIRENEQRAAFQGYATNRYKLQAFLISATITALAGVLFVFHHRFASADPLAITFSGELLAMVVIGGMHSFLGPALGAVFYIIFREFLSLWTPDWLLYFGFLFVVFVIFSPEGLVGVARRLLAPWRPEPIEAAAMAGADHRQGRTPAGLPPRGLGRAQQPGPRLQGPGQAFWRHPCRRRHRSRGPARLDPCAPRTQRCRQDHRLQPHLRHVPA